MFISRLFKKRDHNLNTDEPALSYLTISMNPQQSRTQTPMIFLVAILQYFVFNTLFQIQYTILIQEYLTPTIPLTLVELSTIILQQFGVLIAVISGSLGIFFTLRQSLIKHTLETQLLTVRGISPSQIRYYHIARYLPLLLLGILLGVISAILHVIPALTFLLTQITSPSYQLRFLVEVGTGYGISLVFTLLTILAPFHDIPTQIQKMSRIEKPL